MPPTTRPDWKPSASVWVRSNSLDGISRAAHPPRRAPPLPDSARAPQPATARAPRPLPATAPAPRPPARANVRPATGPIAQAPRANSMPPHRRAIDQTDIDAPAFTRKTGDRQVGEDKMGAAFWDADESGEAEVTTSSTSMPAWLQIRRK